MNMWGTLRFLLPGTPGSSLSKSFIFKNRGAVEKSAQAAGL